MEPRQIFWASRKGPPPCCVRGAGGDERSHGLKLNHSLLLLSRKNDDVLKGWTTIDGNHGRAAEVKRSGVRNSLARLAAAPATQLRRSALAGDHNVVPTDLDIYPTKSRECNALLQPKSRAAYGRLLAQGWTDAIRALHPKEPMYTFWYYMRNRWERKWRSASRPHSAVFRFDGAPTRRRRIRGMEGASDHAPVWMKLRDAPDRGGAPFRQVSGQATIAAATALPKTERSTHRTGRWTGPRSPAARIGQPALSGRPLLVIDGGLLRSSTSTPCRKPFAAATTRAQGWDSLEAPTKRYEMFPAYQSGREFDDDLGARSRASIPGLRLECGSSGHSPQRTANSVVG